MTIAVRCARYPELVRVHVGGELDIVTTPELNTVLDQLLDDGQRHLLMDLAELTFCDSSGLAAFVRGDDRASSKGGWLRLTGATGRVDRVLRISGLAELLRYDREQDQHDPASLGDR